MHLWKVPARIGTTLASFIAFARVGERIALPQERFARKACAGEALFSSDDGKIGGDEQAIPFRLGKKRKSHGWKGFSGGLPGVEEGRGTPAGGDKSHEGAVPGEMGKIRDDRPIIALIAENDDPVGVRGGYTRGGYTRGNYVRGGKARGGKARGSYVRGG